MSELERRIAELERKTRGIPSRWAGASAPDAWLRCDGGNTIRASPLVTGVSLLTSLPGSIIAGLDPGAVDVVTGAETVAPTGSFPAGVGYATIHEDGRGYRRTMMINYSPATPAFYGATAVLAGWRRRWLRNTYTISGYSLASWL